MTLTEARKVLGLGPDEDPRPQLAEFRAMRERIAEIIRAAPNDELARRYQDGLVEFDRALAAGREYLEALGLIPRLADVKVEEAPPVDCGDSDFKAENPLSGQVVPRAVSVAERDFSEEENPEPSTARVLRFALWFLIVLSVLGFGGWAYLEMEEEERISRNARIAFLERQGANFIENRRWPEAAEAFDEIKDIDPESNLILLGRRSIEAGMAEEQNQFIGYWKGEAIAAFEAGRWDDSEKAAKQVLDKYPEENETKALIARIAEAKREEERVAAYAAIRAMIAKREFDAAISAARTLADKDGDAAPLLREAQAAKEKAAADRLAARDLMAQAAAMDDGEFDPMALELMREALSHPSVAAWLMDVWDRLKIALAADAARPDGRSVALLSGIFSNAGALLAEDQGARERLNRAAEGVLMTLLPSAQVQLADFIAGVVTNWDAATVTEKIELRVGRDLQYVRINGTLVGFLAGGVLFAVLTAMFGRVAH